MVAFQLHYAVSKTSLPAMPSQFTEHVYFVAVCLAGSSIQRREGCSRQLDALNGLTILVIADDFDDVEPFIGPLRSAGAVSLWSAPRGSRLRTPSGVR